ncbi:ArsI/CadI family heavy metal resistance metalloenzyme [Cognatiyoonia sp. IB215446]|uniref:ArsI/CadI family heavy metal resistance metalloenzyme n=1 Tax=Cognatiyoonia sp. IB215446 TaxID=3097355 RepID=UPI002A0DEE04|nr:ArsI/CadI family heavy metal resistance metalloenzyme [Cognatiyoonia sp. IB215446]MDX8346664.1 ArsI/CadI family heavy metal resistance metalloenzyme [Cognatiyoonia sp. IB215446]
MNRFHVHVNVDDLKQSISFYSSLFGTYPTVTKDDYAKWLLDDPSVNFAISVRDGAKPGLNHVGLQTDTGEGLGAISARLKAAEAATFDEEATTCCYAVSDKTWVQDPAGLRWETFYTHGDATEYGVDASDTIYTAIDQPHSNARCCAAE